MTGLNRVVSKFASLSMQPEDIVFCFYGTAHRMRLHAAVTDSSDARCA